MKKKRKPRSVPRKGAGSTLLPTALADLARQDLESGRYREAIAHYKGLLKQADAEPSWRTGLAEAYAGRVGDAGP
ncbi:hypothetical protein ABC977_10595 [Thioalkalicoccus limnaeus]|uniref:Tetratricopeptide repeat protein n=1 Tax=Thioalkalicoccus limnaeus TaxID=120681 RepID=A0ABV4BEF3_9GAMM